MLFVSLKKLLSQQCLCHSKIPAKSKVFNCICSSSKPVIAQFMFASICLWVFFVFILTPRTFFPSCSMEQGHQPLTDCCANRDLASSVLCGVPISRSSIIARPHFSGVFAGATRSRKSSSSVPGITGCYATEVRFCNVSG